MLFFPMFIRLLKSEDIVQLIFASCSSRQQRTHTTRRVNRTLFTSDNKTNLLFAYFFLFIYLIILLFLASAGKVSAILISTFSCMHAIVFKAIILSHSTDFIFYWFSFFFSFFLLMTIISYKIRVKQKL